jgi:hypothetical protein
MEAADECNTGVCSAAGTCVPVPVPGASCSSAADDCNAGICSAAGVCEKNPINEADNTAGWTFNQPGLSAAEGWQIGPAMESSCQNTPNPDPAADHTTTGDNGVAGVAIGGCPARAIHDYSYLESPVINADVEGSVWLEFWRFLNSDFKPYMRNSVEVFDGGEWVRLWETKGLPPTRDAAWTRVTHDLTPYKNASLRVRFGFEVQNTLGYIVSGWNIDDVVISNNLCN